jgi:ribose-phosphate pyrophosphokinase
MLDKTERLNPGKYQQYQVLWTKEMFRVPISAALVARLIESSGADRVLSVDLHCGQIQGFFKCPVDNLYAGRSVLAPEIQRICKIEKYTDLVVVSPDAGGAERADMFKYDLIKLLQGSNLSCSVGMAVMNKKRVEANQIARMELVGDVNGKVCIILDDIIDTAGTLVKCSQILQENGAAKVYAAATHGLFNGSALELIEESFITSVVVTDTVPPRATSSKIIQVSSSAIVAESIRRVHNEESLSTLF